VLLFLCVMGGIYVWVFTPSEAGAIGAFGAIVITAAGRRLTLRNFFSSLLETGQITAMIMFLFVGAMIFMRFLAITKLPFALAESVKSLPLPPYAIFSVIVVVYILLGMFLDVVSAVALTIPIIFPTVVALGFDPIWFGVIVTLVQEMGLITPPVGMNVFVLAGATEVPISIMFRGVLPFVLAMLVGIVLLSVFPEIALFIPNMMK
jgi:C4-dicarboxylate transporter DctM subunit